VARLLQYGPRQLQR